MDDWLYNDLLGLTRAMYSKSHFRFTPHSSKQIIKTLDILSIDICDNIIPFDAGSETQKVEISIAVTSSGSTVPGNKNYHCTEYVFMCRLYALTKKL